MKYLRLSLDPDGTVVHPVYEMLTGADYVESARGLNGNVADDDVVTLLFHVRGDPERFGAALAEIPEVLDHDVTRVGDGEFYCYVHNETTPVDGALFAAFSRESIVPASPIEYHDDGRATVAVVGTAAALQTAVDDVPPEIEVSVEQVGERTNRTERVAPSLTDRQREAATAAVELGYYAVPREADHEDVAAALDCAPSTAAEHLRKAESKVFASLF